MTKPIVHALLADVSAVRICLGVVALLFSFGLMFADVHGGAYNHMLAHAPSGIWAIAFAIYGSVKLYLAAYGTHRITKVHAFMLIFIGVYLWLFTFMSFSNNPNRPMGAADMMLLFMLIAEIWVGANTLADTNEPK